MPLWMPRAAYVVSHFKAVEGNTELSKARSNGQSAPTRTDYGHTARARVAAVLWMEATCNQNIPIDFLGPLGSRWVTLQSLEIPGLAGILCGDPE